MTRETKEARNKRIRNYDDVEQVKELLETLDHHQLPIDLIPTFQAIKDRHTNECIAIMNAYLFGVIEGKRSVRYNKKTRGGI